MLNNTSTDNKLIILLNAAGVIAAYVLLIISLYKSTEVPLATKGFWGIGVLMLTISLVNFVKYLFDARMKEVVLLFRPVGSQFKMDHGFLQAASFTGSVFLS